MAALQTSAVRTILVPHVLSYWSSAWRCIGCFDFRSFSMYSRV